ncbi:Spore coat polysaccharide biosynthesis protein spsL [Fibrisoma limi BUZ 3]|uniref:dTDP-4-dehydrorhamnose 3,5-epimerase n=1 Tax=Fibrisoma limi BUZ 3 TaxID=1185876 RepID=I2GKK3_9BACT|nr:dTDP-4-dehydrorhamnose 3,5-epimerase family protein [Fibrisoma limi]CCH54429.1 Spore coat polysaccharide biosynthesis protein spsL [Fibrisoma limi BUZ 3]
MIVEIHPSSPGLSAGQPLAGVDCKSLTEHQDQRGSFTEVFQQYWSTCLTPTQWSLVRSEPNVFRGMHLHQRHDEYFCLIEGHCLVGLYDARPDSPTRNQWALYELFGTDLKAIVFPRGLLHGWYFFTPSVHLQAVSESFVDYGHDDNHGCRWDDPDLGITWGITDPILSDRANSFPPLRHLLADLANAAPSS